MWYSKAFSGRLPAGEYDAIPCNGNVYLTGDIHCRMLSIVGNLTTSRNDRSDNTTVNTQYLYVDGRYAVPRTLCRQALFYSSSAFNGALIASDSVEIRDGFVGRGLLQARNIKISGNCFFNGAMKSDPADEARPNPLLAMHTMFDSARFPSEAGTKPGGDISCATLLVDGLITFSNIRCNDLSIRFQGRNSGDSVIGRNISITRKERNMITGALLSSWDSDYSYFRVKDDIRGSFIDLEYVYARTVIGDDITIGPGCRVETVRYRHNLNIDDSAWVGRFEPLE